MTDWKPIETAPEGRPVLTAISPGTPEERNVQPLTLRNGLWWLRGGNMYVYYTPTHWKETQDD